MKHIEINIEFDYLEAERERLLDHIATVRASGKVAHAYCWLIESTEEKGSRTYTYSTFHFHEVHLKLFNSLLEKGFGRIKRCNQA